MACPSSRTIPVSPCIRSGRVGLCCSPGELGATIQNFHTPELLRMVANAGQPFRPVELLNAPGSVEVVVRAQGDDRTLVHLVNFTGDMTRPIRSVVPLPNVKVRIHSPATKAYTL